MNGERYRCPICHAPGAEIRLDRKSRPYLACTMCACVVFTRGHQALAGLLATLELLDVPSNLAWARQESFVLAERPLAELLRHAAAAPQPVAASSATTSVAAAVGGV